MSEQVHFIPVGFDFERLIHPVSKGEMDADRAVLITHGLDSDEETRAAELANKMTDRLEQSFGLIDIEVERRPLEISDLYDYETLYPLAHEYILDELEVGNEVAVNISSMPRTTAFAFATAADSIITEFQGDDEKIRERLQTYYVAPDDYLVLDMIDRLESVAETLDKARQYEDLNIQGEYARVTSLLDRIEGSGVTEGARDLGGQMYVEFPVSPSGDVDEFEQEILRFLYGKGQIPSTSALAKQLADGIGEKFDSSFRSRVQYNVTKLEEKGYVTREESGNRLATELSTMGRMWVETHR